MLPTALPSIPLDTMACARGGEPTIRSENSAGFAPSLFRAEQHEAFDRDGFLVVSGLLDGHMEDFVAAGDAFVTGAKKMKSYFSNLEMGMIFQAGKSANQATITKAFRHIAFDTILPQAVAELMHLPPTERVRVLRYERGSTTFKFSVDPYR
jgi:hypothetical protein